MTILISDQVDFGTRKILETETTSHTVKGSIYQESSDLKSMCAKNWNIQNAPPKIKQHTFFSRTHETFTLENRILSHKPKQYLKIEIVQSMSSDHNRTKPEKKKKKKHKNIRKSSNICKRKLKYTLVNN